jgi:manganese/zinc/iron transport system permease protein
MLSALDYTTVTVLSGALLLGVTAGTLGTFAVLRRQSLLGDALAHAALPGVALAFIVTGSRSLGVLLTGALITSLLGALVLDGVVRRSRLKTDPSLGLVLSSFFAAGVVLLSYAQRQGGAGQAGLESFLFGQAAALLRSDLWITGGLAAFALAAVLLFWKEWKVATFDPAFAASLGLPVVWLEAALTALVAVAVVLGLQLVGIVLMASMLIAPAVAARQWVRTLEAMTVLAAVFGATAGVVGTYLSAQGNGLATGPLIVLAMSVITAVSLLTAPHRGLLWRSLQRRAGRRDATPEEVLTGMQRLANDHGNPAYPSDLSMLEAGLGARCSVALNELEAAGLIERTVHPPEATTHYRLTQAGTQRTGLEGT